MYYKYIFTSITWIELKHQYWHKMDKEILWRLAYFDINCNIKHYWIVSVDNMNSVLFLEFYMLYE